MCDVRKKSLIILLSIMVLCFVVACAGGMFVYAEEGAHEENPDVVVYTPTKLSINHMSAMPWLYLELNGGNHGEGDNWPGQFGEEIKNKILINGEPATDVRPLGPDSNLIGISHTFAEGDTIVVQKGAKYVNAEKPDSNFVISDTYTITHDGTSYQISGAMDSVEWNQTGVVLDPDRVSDGQKLYLKLENGSTGFGENTEQSLEDLYPSVFLNEKELVRFDGDIKGGGSNQTICLTCQGGFLAGDRIVLKRGGAFANASDGSQNFEWNQEYIASFDGSVWTVEKSRYEMPEGMLSDFTEASVRRVEGSEFHALCPTWGVNYTSNLIEGNFVSQAEISESLGETTKGAYQVRWAAKEGLLYPTVMFDFTQEVAFDSSDELVFRIHLSEEMDMNFTLWIISSLTENAWEFQSSKPGSTLLAGNWNEIRIPVVDFLDQSGKIAPIAFLFHYADTHAATDVIPAAEIYFDTACFESVEKVLADEYTVNDISEIVPVSKEGKVFTGEFSGEGDFDYESVTNVCFARTDKILNGVSMVLSVNDLTDFNLYFVLNGTSLYNKSGIFYWLSEGGISVGYPGKVFETVDLPEDVKREDFQLTILAIPYFVNQMPAGYMAELKINGNTVITDRYISNSENTFGKWFGMYLHDSDAKVSVTLKPQNFSETSPISLKLSTMLNQTEIAVGGSVKLNLKKEGDFYGESAVRYEFVSGGEIATVDENGYVNGVEAGTVVIKAVVTNSFGTFESNTVTLQVGSASSDDGKKSGCFSTMGGEPFVGGVVLASIFLIWMVMKGLQSKKN